MQVSIDKVILIHPEIYTERLAKLDAVYPACLPKYEIPYALTGKDVTPPDWWLAPRNAWALYENARNAVQSIKEDEVTLILEDDCRFIDDFEDRLTAFLSNIPEDWDLLYLGWGDVYTKLYKPYQVNEHCLRLAYIQFTEAIIYNPASKYKILEVLDTERWKNDYIRTHEYDQAYAHAVLRKKLNAYGPLKKICGQFGEDSTLRETKGSGEASFLNSFQYRDLEGKLVTVEEDK